MRRRRHARAREAVGAGRHRAERLEEPAPAARRDAPRGRRRATRPGREEARAARERVPLRRAAAEAQTHREGGGLWVRGRAPDLTASVPLPRREFRARGCQIPVAGCGGEASGRRGSGQRPMRARSHRGLSRGLRRGRGAARVRRCERRGDGEVRPGERGVRHGAVLRREDRPRGVQRREGHGRRRNRGRWRGR